MFEGFRDRARHEPFSFIFMCLVSKVRLDFFGNQTEPSFEGLRDRAQTEPLIVGVVRIVKTVWTPSQSERKRALDSAESKPTVRFPSTENRWKFQDLRVLKHRVTESLRDSDNDIVAAGAATDDDDYAPSATCGHAADRQRLCGQVCCRERQE